MKLVWSRLSLQDRNLIFDYIEADDPLAAASLDERIEERVEGLLSFPQSGRIGRVPGTRERVIAGTPCIAVYRIDGDTVRIERILHGSQQWP